MTKGPTSVSDHSSLFKLWSQPHIIIFCDTIDDIGDAKFQTYFDWIIKVTKNNNIVFILSKSKYSND
jgi:hypothetical protein